MFFTKKYKDQINTLQNQVYLLENKTKRLEMVVNAINDANSNQHKRICELELEVDFLTQFNKDNEAKIKNHADYMTDMRKDHEQAIEEVYLQIDKNAKELEKLKKQVLKELFK